MGKSDEYQFDYLDDNDRFADQVNGALFKGRQVIKPEELEPADMQAVYLGKVRIGKEYQIMENGERKYDMCKAFMDMKLEGIEEGMTLHLVEAVCKKLRKNKPAVVIADELEEELLAVENIIRIQNQVGGYDAERICEILRKNGAASF